MFTTLYKAIFFINSLQIGISPWIESLHPQVYSNSTRVANNSAPDLFPNLWNCGLKLHGYACTNNEPPDLSLCNPNPCSPNQLCYSSATTNQFHCVDVNKQTLRQNMTKTFEQNINDSDFCTNNLCMYATGCANGTCICDLHYEGKYCEHEINYCDKEPCGFTSCIPKFGTFECECPITYTGK